MSGVPEPSGPPRHHRCALSRVYLITTGEATGSEIDLHPVEAALIAGVRLVQMREKGLNDRARLALARRLRTLTRQHDASLLINGRPDLARLAAADGVHLPQGGLPVEEARKQLGENAWIGLSCHNEQEVAQAAMEGADFITFGPVYPTPSKATYGPPPGLPALRLAVAQSPLPVFALGGVAADHLQEVAGTGVYGVAAIRALYRPGGAAAFCAAFPESD